MGYFFLKIKKRITITNTFQNVLHTSNGLIKAANFVIDQWNYGYKNMI